MKRVITYTILLLSIILTTATAHSQSYPVQANLYVMAPYSQTYSDYYADGQQRMFVNILLNDMSQGQLDVVLRFTISGNNLKLISKPNTTAKPITILSGKLCRIEGSELAQYLKPEQMQVEGRKADEFNKSGRLPEGYYEIKVDVVEFYRKVRISAPVYTTMWIMQPEAPVWTMPQNGVRLDATNPQFVMFGWMLTNSTSLLQNVKYTFSIYAKPDNMNPDVVARTTTPLYSETLTQTMLVYGPDKPLLELGGTYVCRIKAEDADGNVTFKNDGYSETLVFRYGQTCDPPRQVTITDVTKKGATVNWVESGNYSGYDIEVRETTEGKSSDWYVWNIDKQVHSYDLKQLAVSSSYECRVAAVCGQRSNGIRSQYSDVVSFKTYDAGNKNYTCGDLVEANKHEDRVPYLYLEEGDVIEANGFLFAIESISKASEGVFSGQCSWYIDLWGVSILCDFKDISINRHQQLIAGKIEACRDKVKAKAFTRLQSAAYMPIGTQVPSTFTAEKMIKMEETVDSIRIVNGQTLIYVAGKEPQKVDATDDVFVQSPDGNYYAVEGGNVYPKPSNLDSEGNRQLSYTQQLVATFGYDDAMGSHPGVDSYTDAKAPFAAQYTQYQLHSNDAYATWMAVEKYRTSMAKVTVSGGDRNAIQLRNNGQSMVRTDATDADALYMPISADGLYEAYYTTQDNKGKDVEVVAGQLNVAAYERNTINVCLVGVNGEHYQYNVSELSNYLNKVFGQAVTSVNLTTASIDVDKFNGTLSAKESGALSAYNSDMKKLIRKVKKLSDYNDETYYIMLVERSDDQTLGGFMPVNSNFGFVFAKANSGKEQLNRTIAHELAHGAFRLWHTFSSENIYVAQQGSTKNLMDYNGTNAELFKYQWDYIHNPQQGIVRWLVEDEESESVLDNLVHYYLQVIHDANANNKNELNLLVENGSIETNEKFREKINYLKMHLDGGLEKLQPAKIDLLKQNIKKTTRLKTEYDVTIDPRERTVETDGTEFVKYSFHKLVNGENTRDIAIQILVKNDEAVWLDYFLYGEMKLKELEQITELTPAEIKEKREYIKTLPEDVRADWYLELQKKVPYHNQRDNESTDVLIRTCNYSYDEEGKVSEKCSDYIADDYSISYSEKPTWANEIDEQINYSKNDNGDLIKTQVITKYSGKIGSIMCNLTSLSMGLEYLGISCPEQNVQFEDYLEKAREDEGFGYRGSPETWSKLAKNVLQVEMKDKSYNNFFSKVKDDFTKDVLDLLKTGKFVIMSVWPSCKGHIVRIVSISDDGITVDDPFGAVTDFNVRENCNGVGYDSNDKTSESAKGHHVLWKWTDIKNVTIKYISYSK